MQLTLRIKRVYFDAIRDGHKTVEYRADRLFYRNLFRAHAFTTLLLHYQKAPRLLCDIIKIGRVANPLPKHERPEFLATPNVWAIYIKNPR